MAEQRIARLVSAREFGSNTRVLKFALVDPLAFTGGQYVIVHTGIPIAEGKTAKRAYSILSSDEDQHCFEVAVRRIGNGPGSNFMHRLSIGEELSFSGPWGKYAPASGCNEPTAISPSLILATDTGITAAIGLLNSKTFKPYAQQADLYWLIESDEYFVPERFVRNSVDGLCRSFAVKQAPPVGSVQRRSFLEEVNQQVIADYSMRAQSLSVFLSGDGTFVFPMRESLTAVKVADIHIETFFNHQEKKTEAKAVAS